MYQADLNGTKVYTEGLNKIGLITKEELSSIHQGLDVIHKEWESGKFIEKPGDEDIHTANERRLGEIIGKHIAGGFISTILKRADREIDVLMPGYTHLQRAQPIRWSHWLSSYATYFTEDYKRLKQILERVNQSPLGAGALAGHPYGIDREFLAKGLGFNSVIEFGFIQLADAYSTGSSLMPQKKNPDSLELLRGKSGRVFGSLSGFLMSIKSIPSTYNKDMQEDKEPLFDALTTVEHSVLIATGLEKEFHSEKPIISLVNA
ncbi:argininosuccinate lyase [Cerrena zonata]|uniref:Argininosuccinate lyase n=1 Tax=Cerrena zonata TaxID=2478898 RepID=A0AAW0FAQ6_9APHY